MTGAGRDGLERRLLVLTPVGKDAALIEAALRTDPAVVCAPCRDFEALSGELARGAAMVLIAEEAFAVADDRLAAFVATQPPWSDLPVLLLTRQGADSITVGRALQTLGNVTLLERPVRVATLASAVRSAMRARMRQYETRAHLEEREEADRRKDEFIATLAHELRNPLAPIRNSVDLLRLTGAAPHLWEMMERQVNHIVRLVDDLMEVSRITRGKIELRREPVALADVMNAAIETSRPLIESLRHELTVTLPSQPLVVDADATRLAQVFANLLNNAAKYTDPGGRISIVADREGADAVVTVSDTGVGIPQQALSKVFDMFVQAEVGKGRTKSGLGIGLTLARNLVEMHGGQLTARSEGPGEGSQFIVRLPGAKDGCAASTPKSSRIASVEMATKQHVLVVDDNRDAADSLGALLEMLGADVQVVYDGHAALATLEAFHPAAIFLDLGMPGIDGFEVARRIRQRADLRDVALIALTGWGQERDRRRTEEAGFDRHLVKPVDPGTMHAVLASVARH